MRFNFGVLRRTDWHGWFAWRPVRLGPSDCRWLEVVFRRGTYVNAGFGKEWAGWEYRANLQKETV